MARFGRRDTAPELALRRELHRRGSGFFVDRQVSAGRVAAGPRCSRGRGSPSSWTAASGTTARSTLTCRRRTLSSGARKLLANRQRDAQNQAVLVSEGWRVLRFWEHDRPRFCRIRRARPRSVDAIAGEAVSTPGRMDRRIEVVAGVLTSRTVACSPAEEPRGDQRRASGSSRRESRAGESAEEALRDESSTKSSASTPSVHALIDRSVTRLAASTSSRYVPCPVGRGRADVKQRPRRACACSPPPTWARFDGPRPMSPPCGCWPPDRLRPDFPEVPFRPRPPHGDPDRGAELHIEAVRFRQKKYCRATDRPRRRATAA